MENVEFGKRQLDKAVLSARFRPLSRSRAFRSERNCPPHTCLRAMRLRLLCFLREEGNPPFRAVPALINIITRCNGSTAGSCFHKVKTAEAPFQSFLFVHKILFTAVLLMQNCKRTEDRIKCAKPSFTVRPSLEPSFLSPPCLRACALKNPKSNLMQVCVPQTCSGRRTKLSL